jgi:DUF2993 family protein
MSLHRVAIVALLALLLAGCADVLDARAESALRDALARVVGPAASYEVSVSGASLDGRRFERVRVVGHRIARPDTPVLDRLALELHGVVVDREHRTLAAVADSRAELQIRADDLAAFLRRWLADPAVVFSAPDRIGIVGSPRLGGIAVLGSEGAEFEGRLAGAGSQLHLRIDRLRIGHASAPPLARALLESALDPVFDLAAYPLPAQIDAVVVADGTLRIAASGSRLPARAP